MTRTPTNHRGVAERLASARAVPALALAALAAACTEQAAPPMEFNTAELPAPSAASASRLPRFASGAANAPVLTWVEEHGGESAERVAELRCAAWNGAQWSSAQVVASGSDWFVNWADFPALSLLDERQRLAHWLERSAEGRYDYSVQIVRSGDGGSSWSAPGRLHSHSGPGEHGFVSLVPLQARGWRAVWLDGRQMGDGGHDSHDAHGGAMALYTREIATDGALGPETRLDERVCDCCPTAALRDSSGAVWVAYRDRDEAEVRDIALLRLEDGREPERIWSSADGWKIAGCPVNGPALAESNGRLAIAWFSMGSDNSAGVHVAVTDDRGRTFRPRVQLVGEQAVGRVDAVFDEHGSLIVSWLEDGDASARWCAARLDRELRTDGPHTIAPTSGARDNGIGRLTAAGGSVLFAFTQMTDGQPRVAVRSLTWR